MALNEPLCQTSLDGMEWVEQDYSTSRRRRAEVGHKDHEPANGQNPAKIPQSLGQSRSLK